MRRALAVVGLILAVAGFIMMPLSLVLDYTFLIPVGLIAAAFLILLLVKRMPSDLDSGEGGAGDSDDDESAGDN